MDAIAKKYLDRINQDLAPQRAQTDVTSRQYKEFKEQYLPKHLSFYERACNMSAKLMPVAPDAKQRKKLEEAISICHMQASPEGVISLSLLGPVAFIMTITALAFLIPIGLNAAFDTEYAGSLFILIFAIIVGVSAIIPLQKLPFYLANNWRMKASNQMVLCVFYIVTYMRHTSNLELAIDFAGEHLAPPLSLDMKKVIWDIETEKYDSVKESLDVYLESWKEWNPEFIESLHLIEGSLLESSEGRRIEMLDKSLSVMLDETYEKMLHYAHNLKSPLTTLHMLGVILPILGLVILPLMVSFIPEVKWFHMAIVYNVTLPGLVFLLAKQILSTRPTGYGSADITDINPSLKKYKMVRIPFGGKDVMTFTPFALSMIIIIGVLFVGIFPLIYHVTAPDQDWIVVNGELKQVSMESEVYREGRFFFLDYRRADPADQTSPFTNGPYGIGALIMSLFIPLAFGIGFGVYFFIKSRGVMKVREYTKKLEQEFAAALFQLGNRLADGLPSEIAFSKVSEVLEGTQTGRFFDIVTTNISKLGMSVEQSIFDTKYGAILQYPSNIIESSMKVLVESGKKGPIIASQAVINVSEYIKQMHRVDERLKDLMSDVISSMKSQIAFLTPVIAGIVIGITSMIASILGTIGSRVSDLAEQTGDIGGAGSYGALFDIFGAGGIPTYHFQAIVGLYVVQITYILTVMVNGIENGSDVLAEESQLGKNMVRSSILYVAVSGTTILVFGIIAGAISNI